MKIRNVRSKDIEFDVDPEDAPKLGEAVTLVISMGDATVARTYKVTRIEARGVNAPPPHGSRQVVVVTAEGAGTDGVAGGRKRR